MDINSLSYKTLKNVSYSFVSYGWGMIFAIFVTPIIVFKLGIDNYGVYIFVNTVVGFMGLVDLGFSSALAKYSSEYVGAKRQDDLKKLLYSANSLFLVMGLVGFLVSVGIALSGKFFLTTSSLDAFSFPVLFLIAGLIFFVNSVNSIYSVVPLALQRFDVSSKIGVAQITFSSLGMLVVVLLGYKLQAIFLVQLIFSIIFTLVFRHYSQKIMPIAKLKYQWHKKEIIKCYKFGLVAYISNISGQTLSYFDKLIIPIFINPAALGYYSLSSSVASKSTGLIGSLTNILFPLASSLKGSEDQVRINKLYIRSFRLTTILSASISFAICFFSYKIMLYWLSEEIALLTYKILIVLAVTYFIISIHRPLADFLLGLGKTKILATFSVLMAITNIIFLFILLPKFGIMGAAIAYLVSMFPTLYMVYYTEKKVLNLNNRISFYISFYSKLIFTGIVFYIFSKVFIYPFITSLWTLLILGPLSVIVYLVIYKIFGFYEEEDVALFKSFGVMFLNKIKIMKKT